MNLEPTFAGNQVFQIGSSVSRVLFRKLRVNGNLVKGRGQMVTVRTSSSQELWFSGTDSYAVSCPIAPICS